jgi:hypothetical protein
VTQVGPIVSRDVTPRAPTSTTATAAATADARLPHTTRAIACVRALARVTMAAVDARTVYRLEATIAGLDARADELEDHAEIIAALLALLPSPDADPHPASPWLSSGMF